MRQGRRRKSDGGKVGLVSSALQQPEPPTGAAASVFLLTPKRLFVLLGILAALAVIAFRAQSLALEREHVLQQRRAPVAPLAQVAATASPRLSDPHSRVARDGAAHAAPGGRPRAAPPAFLVARATDRTR